MRNFFESTQFKILVAVLMVMVGFMTAAVYTGGSAAVFSQIVGFVIEPVQRVSASATNGVAGFFEKYFQSSRNYEENQELHEELNDLRRQIVEYQAMQDEYEQMQKIENMSDQYANMTMETASVIELDHSNPFYTMVVDKGSLDDVALHDPVITEEGLVGYVDEVGLSSCRVVTVLNMTIQVGACDSTTRDIGIVTGSTELAEQGLCKMEYLSRDSGIAVDDLIITSGGGVFPKELIIGKVKEIDTKSWGNSLEVSIEPAVDFAGLKDVFIITDFEGQDAQ